MNLIFYLKCIFYNVLVLARAEGIYTDILSMYSYTFSGGAIILIMYYNYDDVDDFILCLLAGSTLWRRARGTTC